MITVAIYKGTDNTIDLELRSNGAVQDISGTTRMVLKFADNIEIDSRTYRAAFDWSSYGSVGHLVLRLGTLDPIKRMLPALYTVQMTLYDLTYTNGLRWAEGFIAKVEE